MTKQQQSQLERYRVHLAACVPLMQTCLENVSRYFIESLQGGAKSNTAIACQPESLNKRLSPHQEERFKLMIQMVDHFTETMATESRSLTIVLFETFEKNWELLGDNYFNVHQFRIKSMTIFQLFTKIISESTNIDKIRRLASSGLVVADQPAESINNQPDESSLSLEEKRLQSIWDQLLTRIEHPTGMPTTSK